MKKKANDKKSKKKKFAASRRGVIMIAAIALLVLMINIISASYSWFTPENVNGTGMNYSFDGKARSENCQMSTYLGTKVTSSNQSSHAGYYLNQIHYQSTASTSNVSVASGATQYFKTEIINQDTKNASCISLYITTISGLNNTNTCTLAVTYPSNSVRTLNSTNSNFIVRNAYVKRKDTQDVNGPGLLVVEWFVKNNGSNAITVNPSNLYLTYS